MFIVLLGFFSQVRKDLPRECFRECAYVRLTFLISIRWSGCIIFVMGRLTGTCHLILVRIKQIVIHELLFAQSKDIETRSKARDRPQSPQPERLLPVCLRGSWVQETAGTGVSRDCFVVYTPLRKVSVWMQTDISVSFY